MGFFSWKTADTLRSISNSSSVRGALPVYLITPDNEKIYEPEYEGYGIFGGYDAYQLLAQWNVPEQCNGDIDHDRIVGIHIGCYDKDMAKLKYPLKFAEASHWNYDDLEYSESCPDQGFFYEEEDDDDDW